MTDQFQTPLESIALDMVRAELRYTTSYALRLPPRIIAANQPAAVSQEQRKVLTVNPPVVSEFSARIDMWEEFAGKAFHAPLVVLHSLLLPLG